MKFKRFVLIGMALTFGALSFASCDDEDGDYQVTKEISTTGYSYGY